MTAVILHPSTERVIILFRRAIEKTLALDGIQCIPVYPPWGIADVPYLSIKGRISSLAISMPSFFPCTVGYSLIYSAFLTLNDGTRLNCPIKTLIVPNPMSPAPYCLIPPGSWPLTPSSFRIADAVIEESGCVRKWHANSSYWVKTKQV